MMQQQQVVFHGLAESDAGIDSDALPRHPGPLGDPGPIQQERLHLGDHVSVLRIILHGAGRSQHVHQHQSRLARRHQFSHTRSLQRSHVVDDLGPGIQGRSGYLDLGGVDRDHDALGGECRHHRYHPPDLLGRGNLGGTGPGRFAPDVHEVGTLVPLAAPVRDRRLGVEVAPPVGERVGGDVDDPHDQRPLPEGQSAAAQRPGRRACGGLHRPPWSREKASARVAASLASVPRTADVTVIEPGFFTPRMLMHRCSASTTTITP